MIKLTLKEVIGMAAIYCGLYTFLPITNLETIASRFWFFVGASAVAFGVVGTVEIFVEMIKERRAE